MASPRPATVKARNSPSPTSPSALKFAAEFGSDITIPLDVASDEQIDALFVELAKRWDGLDGLVHSIAYAPTEAIEGDFLNGISREAFRIAHDISSYSYAALAKGARPLMQGRKASLLALSYLGAERTMPNYNTMGLAKASLEAATRYLAFSLGPEGIRANAISAGPIKTLAASGIGNFGKLLSYNAHHAPLRRNVTIEEVGNAAAFMLSDLASGITGEIMYVDGGMNTTALGNADPLPA
jgi:enoyl-[acyl-carrier protein] reductase I